MRIEHWIGDDLITMDTDDVWLATFAEWDPLVPTDTAERIATAVVQVLMDADADLDDLRNTEAEALIVSQTRCAEQHERNMKSRMHKRRSVKGATWAAMYHKKCIADLERQVAWHTARINAKNKKMA
jgi:hypothetical protein